MHGPREVLNELRWRHDALDEALVLYVHRSEGARPRRARVARGAARDVAAVAGRDIVSLGRSFFQRRAPQGATSIPYHRVLRIERGGEVVWERRARDPSEATR